LGKKRKERRLLGAFQPERGGGKTCPERSLEVKCVRGKWEEFSEDYLGLRGFRGGSSGDLTNQKLGGEFGKRRSFPWGQLVCRDQENKKARKRER